MTTEAQPGTTEASATTPEQTQQGSTEAIGSTQPTTFQVEEKPAVNAPVVYESTGHAGLDLALTFIGGLGIKPDDPAVKAAESGNFSLLKAKLATMGETAKGWEQMVAVGERDFAALTEKNKSAADAREAEFAKHAGGQEQWAAIKTWASQNAEPAEKQAINAALGAGGIAAKAMVMYLSQIHAQAPNVTAPPQAKAVPDNASKGGSSDSYALSPRQYVTEVQKLRSTVRGAIEDSPAYKQLQARAMAYRG